MVKRSKFPTDRQICMSVLLALANHPLVLDSEVFLPVLIQGQLDTEPVRIKKYRLFGGTELSEPGLTLAVYPFHSSLDSIQGTITPAVRNKSIYYPEDSMRTTLGRSDNANYNVHGVFNIVVQLYYLEPTFNAPAEITFDTIPRTTTNDRLPYGQQIQLVDGVQTEDLLPLDSKVPDVVTRRTLSIEVLPAEEVLRDWMSILRTALRDIRTFNSFTLRDVNVLCVDYPTTNWIQNGNLVFHSAYLMAQFDLTEPAYLPDLGYLPVEDISLTSSH
jgi:hypothetical protein